MRVNQGTAWTLSFILVVGVVSLVYSLISYVTLEEIVPTLEPPAAVVDDEVEEQPPVAKKLERESVKDSRMVDWGYRGMLGPEYWGNLHPDFVACSSGQRQSPINIVRPAREKFLTALKFAYKPSRFRRYNRKRFVRFVPLEKNTVIARDQKYTLDSMIIHVRSEHRIESIPYDMEIQLLHSRPGDQKIILSILVEEGFQPNRPLNKLLTGIPNASDNPNETVAVDLTKLLPKSRTYFYYEGSMTHPPCSEGIFWYVFRGAIRASSAQVERYLKVAGYNSRPPQPAHGRAISKSWK